MSLVSSEIAEQPEVVARLLDRERAAIRALAGELRRRRPRYAVIAALPASSRTRAGPGPASAPASARDRVAGCR